MRTRWFAAAAAALTLSMNVSAHGADKPLPKAPAPKAITPVYKAPPPAAPTPRSWTGCYVGVGGGYGIYNEESALVTTAPVGGLPVGTTFLDGLTQGGRDWLATGQLGCDYQFAGPFGNWLVGAFVDGDVSDMQGRHTGGNLNIGLIQGKEMLRSAWAIGGRAGWLVNPQLLTFVTGGYTEAVFSDVNYVSALFPVFGMSNGLRVPERSHQGWFFGTGTEFAIDWLPGLFWKNEYRYADYGSRTIGVICTTAALCGAAGPTAFAEQLHPIVHTVRTELVWRF
jgi:outer membrane immunogenic protein